MALGVTGGGRLIRLLGVAVDYAARGTLRVSRLASTHRFTRQLSAADAGFAGVGSRRHDQRLQPL